MFMMVSMLSDEVLQRSYLKHSYHHYLACEDSMSVVRNTIGTRTMGCTRSTCSTTYTVSVGCSTCTLTT